MYVDLNILFIPGIHGSEVKTDKTFQGPSIKQYSYLGTVLGEDCEVGARILVLLPALVLNRLVGDVVSNLGSARTGTGEDEMWRLEILRVKGIVPLPDIFGFDSIDNVLFVEQDSNSLMTSFCFVRTPSGDELPGDSGKTVWCQHPAVSTHPGP